MIGIEILLTFTFDMNYLAKARSWGYKVHSDRSNTKIYKVISGIICHKIGDNYWWIDKEDSSTYFINKDIPQSRRYLNSHK